MTYEKDLKHDSYLAAFKVSKDVVFEIAMAHLSLVISWKEKMCMENDFNNFFKVVSGQLKSRILKKSFERFLKNWDLKFFNY